MKVSLITVCYNAESTIRETIESVNRQTYKNIEYIIIDGGSTDNTCAIVEEYVDSIAIFLSEKDEGIYDAINKGISLSTGSVIGIINADDKYEPNAVNCAVELIASGYDYVFGAVKINDHVLWRFKPKIAKYTNSFATKHSVGFFLKKECHVKLGLYDTRYRICADLDLFYKLLKSSFRGCLASENQIFGVFSTSGVSSQVWFENFWEDILIRYRQEFPRIHLFIFMLVRLLRNFPKFLKGCH